MQKASLWSPEAFATDPRNLKESVRRLSIKVEQGGSESDNFFISFSYSSKIIHVQVISIAQSSQWGSIFFFNILTGACNPSHSKQSNCPILPYP